MTRIETFPQALRGTYSRLSSENREPTPPHALVIAEDGCIRRWVRQRLFRAGFEVFVTGSAIDALQSVQSVSPDVIVVDHVVGWLDVGYLLTLLRRNAGTVSTPILLFAPYAESSLTRACQRCHATLIVKYPGGQRSNRETVSGTPEVAQ